MHALSLRYNTILINLWGRLIRLIQKFAKRSQIRFSEGHTIFNLLVMQHCNGHSNVVSTRTYVSLTFGSANFGSLTSISSTKNKIHCESHLYYVSTRTFPQTF